MKIRLQILLFILTCSLLATAQRKYQPGYVVNAKNDTLKGLIDYAGWEYNPKTVNFKSALNAKTVKYNLQNANAFVIYDAESFEKAIVHVSKATINVSNLPVGLDTSYSIDTVFLKVLIKGRNVSLFSFTDDNKTRFYINDRENKTVRELNYYLFMNQTSNWIIEYGYVYRDQLNLLASLYNQDNKLLRLIKAAKYNEDVLKHIVTALNGKTYQQEAQKHLFALRPVAGLAINFNTLTFKGSPGPFPYGAQTKNNVPFIFGALDFIPNKKTQILIFRVQFGYTSNNFDIPYTTVDVLNQTATVDIKQHNLTIGPQVLYNFYRSGTLKVFIDAGANVNISSYNNYSYTVDFESVSSRKEEGYLETSKTWFSFPFKAGVTIASHLELSAGILLKTPITPLNSYTGDVNYYQFSAAFLF